MTCPLVPQGSAGAEVQRRFAETRVAKCKSGGTPERCTSENAGSPHKVSGLNKSIEAAKRFLEGRQVLEVFGFIRGLDPLGAPLGSRRWRSQFASETSHGTAETMHTSCANPHSSWHLLPTQLRLPWLSFLDFFPTHPPGDVVVQRHPVFGAVQTQPEVVFWPNDSVAQGSTFQAFVSFKPGPSLLSCEPAMR